MSIVIPTFCRHRSLSQCLQAISDQQSAPTFEVIVVNDGGSDLEAVLEPFRQSFRLRSIRQDNQGPASARNRGVQHALGERIVFLDDDCRPDVNWLASISRASSERPEAMIGGRTVNLLDDNLFAEVSQMVVDFLYQNHAAPEGRSERFFTTNNLSLPREKFLELGGFDEGFRYAAGEDREFCFRWQKDGLELCYEPKIIVGHRHHMGLPGFLKQHFRYGQAAKRYWEIWSREFGPRSVAALLRPQREILVYALKKEGLSFGSLWKTLLLILAQVATAVGYLS